LRALTGYGDIEESVSYESHSALTTTTTIACAKKNITFKEV
jgi:hypothetical protein